MQCWSIHWQYHLTILPMYTDLYTREKFEEKWKYRRPIGKFSSMSTRIMKIVFNEFNNKFWPGHGQWIGLIWLSGRYKVHRLRKDSFLQLFSSEQMKPYRSSSILVNKQKITMANDRHSTSMNVCIVRLSFFFSFFLISNRFASSTTYTRIDS